MEKPSKYKSVPVSEIYNRVLTPLTVPQKNSILTILTNFVNYFKQKHL